MISLTNQFVPLPDLAESWARETGLTREMMLRRLCDWAVAGGFPDGSFVDISGDKIDTLDIYLSCRSAQADHREMTVGRASYLDGGRLGLRLLAGVLVTTAGIEAFCSQTGARLFATKSGGWFGLFQKVDPPDPPPPCPQAEGIAAAIQNRRFAIGLLGSLRSLLDGLQGKPGRHRVKRDLAEPIHWEWWAGEWTKTRASAQATIGATACSELAEELAALDAEWERFVEDETERFARHGTGLPAPRLQLPKRGNSVVLDGQPLDIPDQPLKLLRLLADRALTSAEFVSIRDIEAALWGAGISLVVRDARDVARNLRNHLHDHDKTLIPSKRLYGYRLGLKAAEIEMGD